MWKIFETFLYSILKFLVEKIPVKERFMSIITWSSSHLMLFMKLLQLRYSKRTNKTERNTTFLPIICSKIFSQKFDRLSSCCTLRNVVFYPLKYKYSYFCSSAKKMALRVDYEGSNDVGVFCNLTNSYCLVGIGGTQNFYRFFVCFE